MGKGRRYLVKWKGYPPEENTWERKATLLSGAREAFEDFEANQLEGASVPTEQARSLHSIGRPPRATTLRKKETRKEAGRKKNEESG